MHGCHAMQVWICSLICLPVRLWNILNMPVCFTHSLCCWVNLPVTLCCSDLLSDVAISTCNTMLHLPHVRWSISDGIHTWFVMLFSSSLAVSTWNSCWRLYEKKEKRMKAIVTGVDQHRAVTTGTSTKLLCINMTKTSTWLKQSLYY